MNIAIIGCGYVGRAMAAAWKAQKHCITVTTRSPAKIEKLNGLSDRVFLLSENRTKDFEEILQGQEILLLCLAADSPEAYQDTYLNTANLLAAILPKFPTLKHLIYTSSTSIYGDHQGRIVTEETPPLPQSPTSHILLNAELQLLRVANPPQRSVCILRLGEIVGPGRHIVDRLRKLDGRPLPGNGESLTNLIHVDDIVSAIDFAVKQSLNGVFNLCNDTHLPRKELYARLCLQEGLSPVQWDPNQKGRHSGNKLVSNAKLRQAGFEARLKE